MTTPPTAKTLAHPDNYLEGTPKRSAHAPGWDAGGECGSRFGLKRPAEAPLQHGLDQRGELRLAGDVGVVAFRQRVGLSVEPFRGRADLVRFKGARRVDEGEFHRFGASLDHGIEF